MKLNNSVLLFSVLVHPELDGETLTSLIVVVDAGSSVGGALHSVAEGARLTELTAPVVVLPEVMTSLLEGSK